MESEVFKCNTGRFVLFFWELSFSTAWGSVLTWVTELWVLVSAAITLPFWVSV